MKFSNKIDKNSLISKLVRSPLGLWHKDFRNISMDLPKTTCGYFASGVIYGLLNILLITWAILLGIGFIEGVLYWSNEVFNWWVEFGTPVSNFFMEYLTGYIFWPIIVGVLLGLALPIILLVLCLGLIVNKYKTEIEKGIVYVFPPLFSRIGSTVKIGAIHVSKLLSRLCKPLNVKED